MTRGPAPTAEPGALPSTRRPRLQAPPCTPQRRALRHRHPPTSPDTMATDNLRDSRLADAQENVEIRVDQAPRERAARAEALAPAPGRAAHSAAAGAAAGAAAAAASAADFSPAGGGTLPLPGGSVALCAACFSNSSLNLSASARVRFFGGARSAGRGAELGQRGARGSARCGAGRACEPRLRGGRAHSRCLRTGWRACRLRAPPRRSPAQTRPSYGRSPRSRAAPSRGRRRGWRRS